MFIIRFIKSLFSKKQNTLKLFDQFYFINQTFDTQLETASLTASKFISNNEKFRNALIKSTFNYDGKVYLGKNIYDELNSKFTNYIFKRKNLNPFSKVISHTLGNNIYFNFSWLSKFKTRRELNDFIVHNLIHERLHSLGYTHKDASDYKSIPYAVGELAYRILREEL